MKTHAFLLVSTCALAVASPSLPTFSERLPSVSDLTLSGGIKSGVLPAADPKAQAAAKWFSTRTPGETRYQSRMPVIDPGDRTDRNFLILQPRDDRDFKMLIHTPRVETAAEALDSNQTDAPIRR